jgi:outer membrane biosynthesis protein TonB
MAENGNSPVQNSKPQGQNQGNKNHNYYRKKNYHSNKPYNNDRREGRPQPQPGSSENAPKPQVQRQPQPQPQPQVKAVQPQNQQTAEKKPYEKQPFNNYRHYNKERRPQVVQVETIDDIKKDIVRIEKEIYLEIEEIKTIKV